MAKTHSALCLILLLALLTACAPLPPVPSPTSTTLPTATAVPPLSISTPEPSPTTAPILTSTPFPQTLEEIARAAYGDRLIEWIRIPTIDVFAPVAPVGWSLEDMYHSENAVWDSPLASVGWMVSSALPGDRSGVIFLYGHNNIEASVFKNLYRLQPGDLVELETGEKAWSFEVATVDIQPVENGGAQSQLNLDDTAPLRLVLLSCYPPDNNTHRVIVTAFLKE